MGTLRLDAERQLLKMLDDEQGQVGVKVARDLSDDALIEIGATIVEEAEKMDTQDLKPSPDLFKSNVYSIHDKSPEQLAVDLQVIKDRIAENQEKAFQKKVAKGEAIRIDLKGKSLEEIDTMFKQQNTEAARRRERERRFSDNPIIATADSVAEFASTPIEYGKKAWNVVKENPGKAIAGAGAAYALCKLVQGEDGEGIDFTNLLLIGLTVVVGGAWMYNGQPELFNKFAGSFGLDKFFNQAPSDPMLKPGLGETVRNFFGIESKFGDVSAESAGSVTTNDAQIATNTASTVQSWSRKTAVVSPAPKVRSL